MTTRRTHTVEAQRYRKGGGFVACANHQADRFVVLEITRITSRGCHAHQSARNIAVFSGAGSYEEAVGFLSRLVAKSRPKPRFLPCDDRVVIGSSLTRIQYEEAMAARREANDRANPLSRSR